MAKITYVEFNGHATTVDAPDGWSLMQAAISNNIHGIVGECGGSMACATCHCYVDEAWFSKLPPPEAGELDMLDMAAAEVKPNSRLSCQIKASPAIDGLLVRLPETQG
ncbi:MAG TPA: 2Fe-2S iron-sulfur cluster-binding protein [Roseiarcus sp.]|nr:2Fe-2S iron-sulfur cluster-binding protein [Roseiarcus sp.]